MSFAATSSFSMTSIGDTFTPLLGPAPAPELKIDGLGATVGVTDTFDAPPPFC